MYSQSNKLKIDSLILNYFIQEGYQEAAISFAAETGIELTDKTGQSNIGSIVGRSGNSETIRGGDDFFDQLSSITSISDSNFTDLINVYFLSKSKLPSKSATNLSMAILGNPSTGYSTINQRKQIKLLILKGSITEAIQKINEYFPTILDTNNLLYFKLLRLNLIEMIRSHKLDQHITNEKEKVFLSDILAFVRENLINKVIHLTKLLKELEITMLLLCFNFDPKLKDITEQKDLPEELRNLFNLSLRNQSYGLVNKAILSLYEDRYSDKSTQTVNASSGIGHSSSTNSISASASASGIGSRIEFDLSNLKNDDSIDLEEFDEQYEFNTPASKKPSTKPATRGKEDEEDLNKLHDLSLESRLEKIIKLWTLTEQRLVDLNIIKQKRFDLNQET